MVEDNSAILDLVFHALADPIRREILRRVAQREYTVTELAQPFNNVSLAAISKHIKVLERASLLRQARHGRVRWCRLNPAPLKDAAQLIAHLEKFWEVRLTALEHFLETQEDQSQEESAHT